MSDEGKQRSRRFGWSAAVRRRLDRVDQALQASIEGDARLQSGGAPLGSGEAFLAMDGAAATPSGTGDTVLGYGGGAEARASNLTGHPAASALEGLGEIVAELSQSAPDAQDSPARTAVSRPVDERECPGMELRDPSSRRVMPLDPGEAVVFLEALENQLRDGGRDDEGSED